ncbi:MAG: UDP-N-acetylmuramoyl-tripeptide--D-alanyl-D-alanine ligase [Bacteroidota bacterium]
MTAEQLYEIFTQYPSISTDTRKIREGSVFFALKGPNFNANAFAAEALTKGAAYAVIDDVQYQKDDRYIVVDNVLHSLQKLAKFHRTQLNIPVIAIVGSNGKTTTKELITSVLSKQFKVLATPGNFNNHIGLPLTLLMLNSTHQIAVIEMGANHIGENAELCEIACPDLGLITNNGKDHLEGFGSIEGVAQSNSELYYYLLKNDGLTFVNANDEWLMRMASRLTKMITYAANDEHRHAQANCIGTATSLRPEIEFTYAVDGGHSSVPIISCLSGDYNFDNIMAAVCIGQHFGMKEQLIKEGIENYEPTNNRSQVIKKVNNTIYLDAYNANPSSMEASLKNFAAMPFNHKIAIIGDMFEMGDYAAQEHANMIAFCRGLNLEQVWLVGEEFARQQADGMRQFKTTAEVVVALTEHPLMHKNVFMKGSRGMKLESLVEVIA